jgi:hypothetical protein
MRTLDKSAIISNWPNPRGACSAYPSCKYPHQWTKGYRFAPTNSSQTPRKYCHRTQQVCSTRWFQEHIMQSSPIWWRSRYCTPHLRMSILQTKYVLETSQNSPWSTQITHTLVWHVPVCHTNLLTQAMSQLSMPLLRPSRPRQAPIIPCSAVHVNDFIYFFSWWNCGTALCDKNAIITPDIFLWYNQIVPRYILWLVSRRWTRISTPFPRSVFSSTHIITSHVQRYSCRHTLQFRPQPALYHVFNKDVMPS